jgi:arsenate reductase
LFETAPPVKVIRDLYEKSGLDIQKLFNVSGEVYREMKLKDTIKSMSVEDKLQLLSSNGRLVKRPIVTDGTHVTVGFNANQYQEAWGK